MGFEVVAVIAAARAEEIVAGGGHVVVMGPDATAVGALVASLNVLGRGRAAGFVGDDPESARAMGEEVFARS